jgi:hypothetical protein
VRRTPIASSQKFLVVRLHPPPLHMGIPGWLTMPLEQAIGIATSKSPTGTMDVRLAGHPAEATTRQQPTMVAPRAGAEAEEEENGSAVVVLDVVEAEADEVLALRRSRSPSRRRTDLAMSGTSRNILLWLAQSRLAGRARSPIRLKSRLRTLIRLQRHLAGGTRLPRSPAYRDRSKKQHNVDFFFLGRSTRLFQVCFVQDLYRCAFVAFLCHARDEA